MAYITLSDLPELGHDISNADDADKINAICETASKLVDAYCQQSFNRTDGKSESHVVRVRNGILKIFPLNLTEIAIKSIEIIDAQHVCSNFHYYPELKFATSTTNAPNGTYYVNLIYDFGFDDGNIPLEVKKATTLTAASLLDDYFLAKDSNISTIKTIKQSQLTITRRVVDEIPKNAKVILDRKYVRVRSG